MKYEFAYFIIVFIAMAIMASVFLLFYLNKAGKINGKIININEDSDEIYYELFQDYECSEKMCGLTNCVYDVAISDILPLIDNPKFICKSCEQVANDKNNLCRPEALSEFRRM